jgi:hypothetical protein
MIDVPVTMMCPRIIAPTDSAATVLILGHLLVHFWRELIMPLEIRLPTSGLRAPIEATLLPRARFGTERRIATSARDISTADPALPQFARI